MPPFLCGPNSQFSQFRMDVTSSRLSARLLGSPRFDWRGEQVAPTSRKGWALLALLAASRGALRREEIAELLWEPGKLASVRQALYELRKLPGADRWLLEEGNEVRLEAASNAAAFEDALADGNPGAALALYEGEFLAGFQDVNAPAFQDWLTLERERFALRYLEALRTDVQRLEAEGQFAAARMRLQQALQADPLDEGHYRTGMRLAYVQGDMEGAKDLLKRCVAMMRREFESEPSDDTLELAATIERGQPLPVSSDLSNLPLPHLRILQALAIGTGVLGVEEIAKVVERPSFDVAGDIGTLETRGLVNAHLAVAPAYLAQVLTSIPVALRRLLHERTAEVLIAGDKADEAVVGRHLLSAGNPAAAAPRFMNAAKAALARSELPTAQALLFRLLWADDGTEAGSLRLEACLLLEGVASQMGNEELQDAALCEGERLAWFRQSDAHLSDVRLRRSRQHLRRGNRGEALELALEALDIGVRLKDELLTARARNGLGGAQFYSGDLDGAAESFRANLAVEDPIERFRANNNLGSLAAIRGDVEESYGYFETALTLARAAATRSEVASTLNNLAATADRLANYALAVKHFRDGLDLARKDRATVIEGQLLVNLAVIYKRQGYLGPAWNTGMEVQELAAELDDLRLASHALDLQAEVKRACGMLEELIPLQQAALDKAEELGDGRRSLMLGAQLVVLKHVMGEAALTDAEAAIESLEEARLTDITQWLRLELALGATEPADALKQLERAGELDNRHRQLLGALARVRAELLPGGSSLNGLAADEAAALAQELLSTLEVVERPYGWWLLRRWYERNGAPEGSGAPAWLGEPESTLVAAALAEQGEGLPKALRERLKGLPKVWAADIAAD